MFAVLQVTGSDIRAKVIIHGACREKSSTSLFHCQGGEVCVCVCVCVCVGRCLLETMSWIMCALLCQGEKLQQLFLGQGDYRGRLRSLCC